MATILLSAAGAALGGALGGGALGLSSVVIGRAIGATIGRAIDQSLMGSGSETIETGKLDRMRVMGASEGSAIPRIFGRVRVPGNVIWTSNYLETVTEYESGGKGSDDAGLFLFDQCGDWDLRGRDFAGGPDLGRWEDRQHILTEPAGLQGLR